MTLVFNVVRAVRAVRSSGLILGASSVLLGCASLALPSSGGDGAQAGDVSRRGETDVYALNIAVGRSAYLIELASNGAIEGQPASSGLEPFADADGDDDAQAAMAADIAATLRNAVFTLYELRSITCQFGLVERQHCGRLVPPDWLGEPPDTAPSIPQLNARALWLEQAMAPYVAAGCEAGERAVSADASAGSWAPPHYCSVE